MLAMIKKCARISRLFTAVLLSLFPAWVWAALSVTAVTLNGGSSVSVDPGSSINALVTVNSTASTTWSATAWRVSTTAPGATTCTNHGNHNNSGTFSETITITAPTAAGTYNAYFVANSNSRCSGTSSAVFPLANSVTVLPPGVVSINRVNGNPTTAATVSWTVTFNRSVSNVTAAAFALVPTGTITGAGISSVSGSGATYTVTAYTGDGAGTLGLNLVDQDTIVDGYGNPLGGVGAGNGNFTGQVYSVSAACSPPANIPSGVTVSCVCDRFARTTLNPSTIFGSNWIVSTSDSTGILPSIVNPGFMRLTNATGGNAKAATVPGIFPAAGNYISVEFQHYAYSGSGADGIAVTLSDYSVPAVPGAFGGSLGYAQKNQYPVSDCTKAGGCPGFAGGWIGVALDEFGNYQNPSEGRLGGPGAIAQSVGVRGSGSGMNGYRWLGGTGKLSPQIDNSGSATPAPGYTYQVVVDARKEPASTSVVVNRDTGSGYQNLINIPNVYSAASAQGFTQAAVPANWQISFTGSTGDSVNIHEIGALRVCAQTVAPPSGGVASGFNAIDEGYGAIPLAVQSYLNGHIYTKLMGVAFKLNVAALNNNQIATTYAAGANKSVTLKLVDNSDGACVLDSSKANYCSATCRSKSAVNGGSQTLTFSAADAGQKLSADFTLNTAYRNLVAIISDGTTNACSTDAFSVRPTAMNALSSVKAINSGVGGTPVFKAVTDKFDLTVTTSGIAGNANGYTGTPKINNAALTVISPAVVGGSVAPTLFPASVSGTPNSVASSSSFSYSEVGGFFLRGYNPANDSVSPRGVFDGVMTATECASPMTAAQCDSLRAMTWTGADSVSTSSDCVADSFSNTKDASGKYGCNFGLVADSGIFGRFIPDHFAATGISLTNRPAACAASPAYSYFDEAMNLSFTLEARAGDEGITRNYGGTLAKLDLSDNANLKFAAAQVASAVLPNPLPLPYAGTSLPFKALSSRLALGNDSGGNHFTGSWPAPGAKDKNNDPIAGVVTLQGAVTVSSLNSPAQNRMAPDGPFLSANIAIAPKDSDGVRLAAYDLDSDNDGTFDSRILATTALGFGMLRLNPGLSSELLPLTMSADLLIYNGFGFVPNGNDSCTTMTYSNLGLGNWTKNLSLGETCIAATRTGACAAAGTALVFNQGNAKFWLRAPGAGNNGTVNVTANLAAMAYLQGRWGSTATAYNVNPSAVASFGIYKGANQIIHLRENF